MKKHVDGGNSSNSCSSEVVFLCVLNEHYGKFMSLFWSHDTVFTGAHRGLKLPPAHPLNIVGN